MPQQTLVNGCISHAVPADCRGLAYGDGLFETIKVNAGYCDFLRLHLERLQRGCERLAIPYPQEALEGDIKSLFDRSPMPHGVLKIILCRSTAHRGYAISPMAAPLRVLTITPEYKSYCGQQTKGVVARLCDYRLPINPQLAGLKHLCRLENVMARAEWTDECIDEGLMLDMEGRLIEGTMSNVFLVIRGQLFTPALHRCGVEGVVRRVIIERIAPALGLAVKINDLVPADLYRAEEIFVCNSLIGLWPVIAVGCLKKTIGKLTNTIQAALAIESQDSRVG